MPDTWTLGTCSLGKLEEFTRALVLLQSLRTTMASPLPAERTLIVRAYDEVYGVLVQQCRPWVLKVAQRQRQGHFRKVRPSPNLQSWIDSELEQLAAAEQREVG